MLFEASSVAESKPLPFQTFWYSVTQFFIGHQGLITSHIWLPGKVQVLLLGPRGQQFLWPGCSKPNICLSHVETGKLTYMKCRDRLLSDARGGQDAMRTPFGHFNHFENGPNARCLPPDQKGPIRFNTASCVFHGDCGFLPFVPSLCILLVPSSRQMDGACSDRYKFDLQSRSRLNDIPFPPCVLLISLPVHLRITHPVYLDL